MNDFESVGMTGKMVAVVSPSMQRALLSGTMPEEHQARLSEFRVESYVLMPTDQVLVMDEDAYVEWRRQADEQLPDLLESLQKSQS